MCSTNNTILRRALLLALLIGLTACTDPLDRVQGEPNGAEPAQTEETHGSDY